MNKRQREGDGREEQVKRAKPVGSAPLDLPGLEGVKRHPGWTLALIAWLLFGLGAAQAAEDNRSPLLLTAEQRSHVLTEMRGFLIAVHGVLQGATRDDSAAIAQAARKAGIAAAHAVPQGLREKLPMPFRKLGSDTHKGFDLLAMDAESLGDAEHSLKQLSQLMGNCLSCHDLYLIEVSP